MTDIEENPIDLEIDEVNLEDLIVLGERKKIPITITYYHDDGTKTRSKTLIRQLTLDEMENIPTNTNNLYVLNIAILRKAMFKADGSNFTKKELGVLPIGVVNAISQKIKEISGMEFSNQNMGNF